MPRIRQLASELRRALTEFEPGRYSIAECGALAVELGKAAEIVAVPAHEHELLDLAKRAGSGPVKRQAHKRYQESLPAEELHERRKHAREFVHWEDKLGMIHLHAALVPEVGQRLVNRLEAETDRLWLRLRRDGTHHTREQLTADAFARLIDPDHPLPAVASRSSSSSTWPPGPAGTPTPARSATSSVAGPSPSRSCGSASPTRS